MKKRRYAFPSGFSWGASTSSHQVEGGHTNDWTEWEASPERLEELRASGKLEKYGLENFVSGDAVMHWQHYRDDFLLAKDLGHNATRFSLEWSRIEPEEGRFDEGAIAHYRDVLQTCHEFGLEPFVTLWHWPIPLWLRDKGGWESKEVVEAFSRYVEKIVSVLGDQVHFWITLNEPDLYTRNSYLLGVWPPQKKSKRAYIRVLHRLIAAHRKAYDVIHRIQPRAMVGIAKNNSFIDPQPDAFLNRSMAAAFRWWHNDYLLQRIGDRQDFIGLNHYFHDRYVYGKVQNENKTTSDLGWELYPEALYYTLVELRKYKKPIFITENGLADAKDEKRTWFLIESLKQVHRAIKYGVEVRGYLHWSLLDNFEWDSGFWPQFGLIAVGKDMVRRPRKSALVYRDICLENGLTGDILKRNKKPLS
ncbi:glycoside hydrolase family 1 protein [bacterium]|nr:glycoside hydrolase family 1 protein [bacterium]